MGGRLSLKQFEQMDGVYLAGPNSSRHYYLYFHNKKYTCIGIPVIHYYMNKPSASYSYYRSSLTYRFNYHLEYVAKTPQELIQLLHLEAL